MRVYEATREGVAQPEAPSQAPSKWQSAGVIIGGPAAVGLCLGLQSELGVLLTLPWMLPAMGLLICVITLPGLYVGAAMLESAPAAPELLKAVAGALSDGGIALLGLCPALLVLTSTTSSVDEGIALVTGVLGLGFVLTLRSFWRRIAHDKKMWRLQLVMAVWACICTGLSWQLYWQVLRTAGGI